MSDKDNKSIPLRQIKSPDAEFLGEWLLIISDIEYCIKRIDLWEQKIKGDEPDVAVSIIRDAIITFISCFEKSGKVKIDLNIDYKSDIGASEYFDWLFGLRNSWVAHRHGASRQIFVGYILDESDGTCFPGHLAMNFQGPVLTAAPGLKSFFSIALRAAQKKASTLEEKIMQSINNLPIQQLMAIPIVKITKPRPQDQNFSRKKYLKQMKFRKP